MASSNSAEGEPFRDPELPPEERIDDLLRRMTLAEKIQCLSTNPSVPRLGVQGSGHVEGLHGLALGGPGGWGREQPVPTTTWPQAIGLAETWDPELVRRVAEAQSEEARYFFHVHRRGGLVVRAPNADLGRDPRWGRTEECFGEDPYLVSSMATAFTRGLQGSEPRHWRAASLLKHFLANSNEDERERSSSDFDQRAFFEYYATPFQAAIERGGSRAFMAAYNKVCGIPCTVHPSLREVAVAKWGQDGIICTDAGALKFLVSEHQSFPNLVEAAAACVRAGINQFLDDFTDSVTAAVEQGLLTEQEIEVAIRGPFRVMLRLGLWDSGRAVAVAPDAPNPVDLPERRAFVREVTRRSVVLLKNRDGALPLLPDDEAHPVRSIAVIGPLADVVHLDWYSGTPPYLVTPLAGIRARAEGWASVRACTNNDTSEAVRLARSSDVCIVCVGNHPTGDAGWAKVTRESYGKEAVDRRSLDLEDEALVRRVFAANPRTILVLISSFPYAIQWSQENVPAIVHLTHGSQELGSGLADVLFGDCDPGGRLVQTWPKSLEQLPPRLDYELSKGRTYQYSECEPLYPFGHGLSYTTFEYRNLVFSSTRLGPGETVLVQLEVHNTGSRTGDCVVQLYLGHPESRVPRPLRALRGFQRVALQPGERRTVTLPLDRTSVAHYDASLGEFVQEPGPVEVLVGSDARSTLLQGTLWVSD